jgi:hypothetical protein
MPINILFHDTRLGGLTPIATPGLLTHSTDATRSLSWFFETCRREAAAHGGIRDLTIMAHGLEHPEFGGGYGIQFCRENINNHTVGNPADDAADIEASGFALLYGMVERIILCVCSSAAHSGHSVTLTDGTILDGDGFGMCRRMAINAYATVVASSELQAYRGRQINGSTFGSPGDPLGFCIFDEREELVPIDFEGWEGRVYTFDENGNVINETVNPSAWRDSRGEVHDPRELSAPPSDSTPVAESWYCSVFDPRRPTPRGNPLRPLY